MNKTKILFFLSLFLFEFAIYSIALPGYELFDDWPSLDGLKSIENWRSILVYIFSGDTGPLGRPVSLATFAIQASAWPDDTAALIRVNIFIHILATISCFFLATGLARLRLEQAKIEQSFWIGLAVAALWGLSPFLATTHLMIVQRMTSLAGFFVLSGLALFVWAHLLNNFHLQRLHLLLFLGLGVATFLATFSKENGALLPLLALTILWLWINPKHYFHDYKSRSLVLILAIVPSVLLLGYLAMRLPDILQNGYGPYRYFTPEQRLITQPSILLDYLRNLILPRAVAASPFMDRLPVAHGWLSPPITLFAVFFWISLIFLAVKLRHAAPYFIFGLTFFLVGHLLESTFLGLELYFAHRNYVPSFGIYFAIVFAALTVKKEYLNISRLSLISYIFVFSLILFQVTLNWNEQLTNAKLWFKYNPDTERGAQFLSTQYIQNGKFLEARHVLDLVATRNPKLALIQIQRTGICIKREDEFSQLLDEVVSALRVSFYQPLAALKLAEFANEDPKHLCQARDHVALIKMADALLKNEPYTKNPVSHSQLLLAKAFSNAELGETDKAISFFKESFKLSPNIDVVFYTASLMANTGNYDKVYNFLSEARAAAPQSFLEKTIWINRLDDFLEIMRESQRRDVTAKLAG